MSRVHSKSGNQRRLTIATTSVVTTVSAIMKPTPPGRRPPNEKRFRNERRPIDRDYTLRLGGQLPFFQRPVVVVERGRDRRIEAPTQPIAPPIPRAVPEHHEQRFLND